MVRFFIKKGVIPRSRREGLRNRRCQFPLVFKNRGIAIFINECLCQPVLNTNRFRFLFC